MCLLFLCAPWTDLEQGRKRRDSMKFRVCRSHKYSEATCKRILTYIDHGYNFITMTGYDSDYEMNMSRGSRGRSIPNSLGMSGP